MIGPPYEVYVYYHGPRSAFSLHADEREIIFEGSTPWLSLARWMARTHIGNTGRCGYVIRQGDKTIEETNATNPAYASL